MNLARSYESRKKQRQRFESREFIVTSHSGTEMQKAASLEKVNTLLSTELTTGTICSFPDNCYITKKSKSRCEHYLITINHKIRKSSSLTDVSSGESDHNLNFKYKNHKFSPKEFYESAGDTETSNRNKQKDTVHSYMFHSNERKKNKKNVFYESYTKKYSDVSSCAPSRHCPNCAPPTHDYATSSCSEQNLVRKGDAFPFKTTPSGNLKICTNQVVFQSSTVGVLLADPTQAKVKVKFEGKPCLEQSEHNNIKDSPDKLQSQREIYLALEGERTVEAKLLDKEIEEKGKNLHSLGYALSEPIDWLRVQLPKKQDLYHEFYRRIHKFINTDTVVHIGNEKFNCHRIVLQIYSSYFDSHPKKEIELPSNSVTVAAFKSVYEWMTSNGADCYRILRRSNILDLFTAAQFLAIKDLEEQCWSFILNENLFTEDTAFALLREARAKKINSVVELMVPRVMRFFLPLVASRDFLDLDLEEILILLNSNHICVTSELEVLMAGVRWLYGQWNVRHKYVAEVMRCVRFGHISPWQLVDLKRNPENAEILDVVNSPAVQEMIDDGLAYVIIKYWYANNSKNYQHWIDVLGLKEPSERNWIGEEKNHVTYIDFLNYLDQFRIPKDQMYQKMAMMQHPRRNETIPGLRGPEGAKDMRRLKMDFPLPDTLKRLTCDNSFPSMSQFFENKMKNQHLTTKSVVTAASSKNTEISMQMKIMNNNIRRSPNPIMRNMLQENNQTLVLQSLHARNSSREESAPNNVDDNNSVIYAESIVSQQQDCRNDEKNCYKTATGTDGEISSLPVDCSNVLPDQEQTTHEDTVEMTSVQEISSGRISLFNRSKESSPNYTGNKLSTSFIGPSNRNYCSKDSLFSWDKETVLVFGGTDPHSPYDEQKNAGKDINRFDPLVNAWDKVGELPEPRHHHCVAFLRGKVYLVGGANPSQDEEHNKSLVLSTVWSFDPVTRSWASEPALGVPRKSFSLVVHRLALYAIGGQDRKGRVLRSVERFDPKSRCWRDVRPMSVARMGPAAAKYRDCIWVAGGMTGDRRRPVSGAVEYYNSKTNQWTEIYSLRFPRCFSSLCAMNNILYLIGGAGRITEKDKSTNSVGCVDIWDWKEREWQPLTEMAVPRHGHALAYLGTQLIIIGGVTTIYMQALNDVESYCCERAAWIRGVAALPSPLSGHAAATLPPASLM